MPYLSASYLFLFREDKTILNSSGPPVLYVTTVDGPSRGFRVLGSAVAPARAPGCLRPSK